MLARKPVQLTDRCHLVTSELQLHLVRLVAAVDHLGSPKVGTKETLAPLLALLCADCSWRDQYSPNPDPYACTYDWPAVKQRCFHCLFATDRNLV